MMTLEAVRLTKPTEYRWTSEEYYRLAGMGGFDGKRVELIEGTLIEMPPIGPEHAAGVSRGNRTIMNNFGPEYSVRVQLPLHFEGDSDPEPDFAVAPGDPREYRDQHPTTAVLVIEVSDSSLEYDRSAKVRLYARAGIPDYWIVNVQQRRLEVYRDPGPIADVPGEVGYREQFVLGEENSITPLASPAPIRVADLLP